MRATIELLDALNVLLADELTAIDQYSPHVGRAESWGYAKHAAYIAERRDDERKHADMLIRRIYELEGVPVTTTRNEVRTNSDLFNALLDDRMAEIGAIAKYNAAIKIAVQSGDDATRDMLTSILKDEDDHLLDLEKLLVQIAQVQLPQWLSMQIS